VKTVIALILTYLFWATAPLASPISIQIGWDGTRFNPPDERVKIGLALSGGGARGLSQIGILKAFEETGFQIGAIAGTSIGGIIGGLYASGYSADSIEQIINSIDFAELFSNRPQRNSMFLTQRQEKERYLLSIRFDGFKPYFPQALTAGQMLSDLLSSLTLRANYISGGDFKKLKYPFCAVTTDIVSGQQINLTDGYLADAIRATMAFPLAFTGVEMGNRLLMDGGIVNPIPVSAIPNDNNDLSLIVAVNTTSDLLTKDAITDPIDIANQVTTIMQNDNIEEGLNMADLVITPEIDGYHSNDFNRASELIELGYLAGLKAVGEIKKKLNDIGATDSICIAKVSFTDDMPENWPDNFPIKKNTIIKKSSIRTVASRLYQNDNLFSISIKAIPSDSVFDRYPAYNLEVSTLSLPKLEDLNLRILGNSIIEDSVIESIINSFGNSTSGFVFRKFADSLNILYESKGCDLAHIRRIDYSPQQRLLSIIIDEAVIEKINVSGNKRTKDWLIKTSFPAREGKAFNSRDISRGIGNIYGTDLFDRVTINIVPGTNGAIVNIAVEEKKYSQIRLGWHWHDEYGSEQFIELLDDNLFGTGQEYLMHAQYAPRRQKYEISLKADRFFSTYLTYRIKVYYHLWQRYIYNRTGNSVGDIRENRRGIEFILGQQIARFGTVTGEIRWEDIESKSNPDGYYTRMKLRTATIRSRVETIDKYPFPTEGKKHVFYFEFAADILGGETKYTKGFSSVESYFPITENINFHPRFSIGWTVTENNIPASERFYIGGRYSFRGLRTDQLTGAKMVLGNIELRFKLPYRLYLSGFYDFGEVYKSIDQIKFQNLRFGYGVSLAYDSPLGPIDIGYGKTVSQKNRLYINVGLLF